MSSDWRSFKLRLRMWVRGQWRKRYGSDMSILVNVSEERAHEIKKSTQTQAADPEGLWQKERQIRVTSSTAGKIVKGRAGHEAGKVKDLLHSSFRGSNAGNN